MLATVFKTTSFVLRVIAIAWLAFATSTANFIGIVIVTFLLELSSYSEGYFDKENEE